MKHKEYIKKLALTAALMAGVSAFPLMRHIVASQTADFDKTQIVAGGDTLSMQDFYRQMEHSDNSWKLVMKDGRVLDVDSLTDFRQKDEKIHNYFSKLKLENSVDTVRVRLAYGLKKFHMSGLVFGMGAKDSLGYLPSLGVHNFNRITIRHFKANSDELQKVADVYNDEYNCTYTHENQHYKNAISGMARAGQSYEIKFVDTCMDEVSANLAQLVNQRANYLKNDKDLSYITPRFAFYRDAVKEGKIKPIDKAFTKDEINFIANGVFDTWMKDKFDMYVKNNTGRTINVLRKTNYNGVQPDVAEHVQLMHKCFTINEIDFYSAIAGREKEIFAKIPETSLKTFSLLKKRQKLQMSYLDNLEQKRMVEGKDKYDTELSKNKSLSMLRRVLFLDNQR